MLRNTATSTRDPLVDRLPPILASAFVVVFTLVFGRRQSMWGDELFSANLATGSFGDLVHALVHDEPNMAPYYAALWSWARIDDGDLWLRALSTVGTVVAIWGIWTLARRWSGALAGALAVGVFALSPFVLGWSMQARGYTWAAAGVAWSAVLADRVLTRRTTRAAIGCGAVVGLTIATQFAAAYPMLGMFLALVVLARRADALRSLAIAALTAAVVFLPFGLVGLAHPNHIDWIPEFSVGAARRQFGTFVNGPLWILVVVIGLVLAVVGLRRGTVDRRIVVPLVAAVVGFAAILVESVLLQPMFLSRYLLPGLPLALVAAAAGWASLPRRATAAMATVVGVVAASTLVVAFDGTRTVHPQGYREAAVDLAAWWRPGDALLPEQKWESRGFDRYWSTATGSEVLVDAQASRRSGNRIVAESGATIDPVRIWTVRLDGHRASPTEEARYRFVTDRFPQVVGTTHYGELVMELRSR